MTTTEHLALIVAATDVAARSLGVDVAAADQYASAGVAANTRKAYAADLACFTTYCAATGVAALPATVDTIRGYLAWLAAEGKAVATIRRRLASIAAAHQVAGVPSPTTDAAVRATMRGIARSLGSGQRLVAPLTIDVLRAAIDALPMNLHGRRDRALLALGFAGAMRRSELVALDLADIRFVAEGLEVTVRRSKTDQEGHGRVIGIPYGRRSGVCPVALVRDWLAAAGFLDADGQVIGAGPLLRSVSRHGHVGGRLDGSAIARIVKAAAEAAGVDADQFSGHSLRAGFVTTAAVAGIADRRIMDQTGHKSDAAFRTYVRRATVFHDNAASDIL